MITITEALAELKTLEKRIEKKRQFILLYSTRYEGLRDPLSKDGGSPKVLAQELQSIDDLTTRHIKIRTEIQKSNHETKITVGDLTRSVAEWLTWRKEVATGEKNFLSSLIRTITQARHTAQTKGGSVVSAIATTAESKPTDLVVNIDEGLLGKEDERIEEILGSLDGQLSLRNATTTIEL